MDSFSILFFLRKSKSSQSKPSPIYGRITVNGKRAEISTQRSIASQRWDSRSGRVKGNREDAREINAHLDNIQLRLNRIHSKLLELNQDVNAGFIKDTFNGKDKNKKTLIEVFDYHNKQLESQIGKGYALGTYTRFETTKKHVLDFLKTEYKKEDVVLQDLDYSFIARLDNYFKVIRNCNHNTAQKYIRNLRKIVNMAVLNDWLPKDPFARYKVRFNEVKRDYLNKEELAQLEQKEFEIERLDQVRDVFVFCCYTGLAYTDVAKLTPRNISKGLDGDLWIFIDRTKTGSPSNVPVLPKAQEIIDKYLDSPTTVNQDKLLPVISNQKMNAYLKEIATVCGISKNITFHIARHTFATTVTLSNGVSIESVSSMLGHKNMKTTQIYAKVVQEKVSNDMKKLKSLFD
ncbi:site-specific integrase [Fulvivirga ligni]|uniref:site-specific integrase n=1 Tax=Fulvivirga ligni TaxID=2904246 RepID=UPI001F2650AE|nr:site-specific integrase [Fulvivirga ligni]UII21198.1 site-specific integrase [Fulvivirga ligni]